MAGIVDGLGFEEIGQAGSQVAAVWITGSVISQSNISGVNVYATTQMQTATFSGTNIYAQTLIRGDTLLGDVAVSGLVISGGGTRVGAIICTSATNTSGLLTSVNVGSPTTFGGVIQAGSFDTAAGSGGTILFGKPFANADYFVTISPLTLDVDGAGSVVPTASGTKSTSGCAAVGAASATYAYIAVGT